MPVIPIVFSTDHNYIMQTGVCLLSLIESAQAEDTYDIHILISDDVTETDKKQLTEQVGRHGAHKIGFISTGNEFADSFQIRGISTATYYRLLIPWLLPQYDKIIFSDVDVIFHISLSEVFDQNIDDFLVAAIPAINFRKSKRAGRYTRRLGVDPNEYFNAGFLVINSKLQRELDLRPRFLELAKRRFKFQDQDMINIVCKGRIKPLSPRYCLTPTFYEMYLDRHPLFRDFYGSSADVANYVRGSDCILHYAGPKPWNAFTFAYTDWWDTYRRSIFCDPDYAIVQSAKSLRKRLSWREIASQIKCKILRH